MNRILCTCAIACPLLLRWDASAQTAELVKDIAPGFEVNGGSRPTRLTVAQDRVFFAATTQTEGRELWKTDGTPSGTSLVMDIGYGLPSDDHFLEIASVGSRVFFGAADSSGSALWRSDGGPEDTIPLSLPISYPPRFLTPVGDLLFFVEADSEHGSQLRKSDGTPSGTTMVKDINPGPTNSFPILLTDVQGTLFFFRSNLAELWKSDGTESGTIKVADLSCNVSLEPVGVGAKLFFDGCDTTSHCGLWVFDSANSSSTLLTPMTPSTLASDGRTLFFVADDGMHGPELWKSDGTAMGTQLVKDINPGPAGSTPWQFVLSNGIFYFTAYDGSDVKLWKTDGSQLGTVAVADLPEYPKETVDSQGTLYFSIQSQNSLWKSDGTQAGTTLVKQFPPELAYVAGPPSELTALNGFLIFAADDGVHGRELWKSDGTEAGTVLLKQIDPEPIGSAPAHLANTSGGIYFSADDRVHGRELWKSDGTEGGTYLVKDINVAGDSGPAHFLDFNGQTLFSASDQNGNELWRTDGTADGTSIVKSIPVYGLKEYKGSVILSTSLGLWKTDGTESGTVPILDQGPLVFGGDVPFVELDGTLFFFSIDQNNRYSLWRTDATAAGTQLVRTLDTDETGLDPTIPGFLTKSGSLLYFVAFDTDSGAPQVWKSDGTSSGTVVVKKIVPAGSGAPVNLTDVNGELYFASTSEASGWELWKSDGTQSGTLNVKTICLDCVYGSFPLSLTNVSGILFFNAQDIEHGRELWKSDGTESGTTLVRDIREGPSGSDPQNLLSIGGVLLFAAGDAAHGFEIWQSDGTDAGTTLVADVNPGPSSSGPSSFVVSGSRVFFSANDGVHGSELWTLTLGTTPITVERSEAPRGVAFRPPH